LELGCGSGGLTALMIRRGAVVKAVDQSEAMLRRARRHAPQASFARCNILNFKSEEKFDRVLLAFVLHHMESDDRLATLKLASKLLKSGGLVGILDWSEPRGSASDHYYRDQQAKLDRFSSFLQEGKVDRAICWREPSRCRPSSEGSGQSICWRVES
jgi:trans-aconitate methyltransferase